MPWWWAMKERTTTLRLAAALPGRRVVDRLEEAEPADKALGGQALQVGQAASGATISASAEA
jgi:hypothetical protein